MANDYGIYARGLRPEQIDDLVENTLNSYMKDTFVDISTTLQEYFAMSNMLLGERVGVEGGVRCQWQIKLRNTGNAKNTGLYGVDQAKVADVTKSVTVPWTMQRLTFPTT